MKSVQLVSLDKIVKKNAWNAHTRMEHAIILLAYVRVLLVTLEQTVKKVAQVEHGVKTVQINVRVRILASAIIEQVTAYAIQDGMDLTAHSRATKVIMV